MDDIIRDIDPVCIDMKLDEINNLHPTLKFTIERENNNQIPFLDMLIKRDNVKLSSSWYTKTTDTGLTMNYHALAPLKYKRAIISGLIHRIFRACSTWKNVDESLIKAKRLLHDNQYPPSFYENIIKETLNKIMKTGIEECTVNDDEEKDEEEKRKIMLIEYRGEISENFKTSLKKCSAPINMIFTIRKLRSEMPTLKPPVEKFLKSGVVYEINCPRCSSCYVGQTTRHLLSRIREHSNKNAPVGNHFMKCNVNISFDDVKILTTSRYVTTLMTLEALWINTIKPDLNTKDEYKSRTLTLKILTCFLSFNIKTWNFIFYFELVLYIFDIFLPFFTCFYVYICIYKFLLFLAD